VKILLDTNILVYAHDPAEAMRFQKSTDILQELRLRGNGVLSVQSLAEFFSAITRPKRGDRPRLDPAEAAEQIQLLSASFQVYSLTSFIVIDAARGVTAHQLAYYDAQIWATARLNQVPVVFSEDFQDGWILEGVRFANPFAPEFELGAWF
jgi:predicted nucleic acid-binding protein